MKLDIRNVYMDNAATTKVDEAVAEVMHQSMIESFGNPSSVHAFGRRAKISLENARAQVAALLNAQPDEILFTSGGTEADNLALRGIAYAYKDKGNHIITTNVEHHAVLHTCEQLEKEGFSVTYLPVDEFGRVSATQVQDAIIPGTILISIMYANNEIGTVMPIEEIGVVAKKHKVLFHTDAVQAAGQLTLDVVRDHVDLLTMTAHKIYGPKGAGALFVRRGVKIKPIMFGGAQERTIRPGTESLPAIVGLGKAAELAKLHLEDNVEKVQALRDYLCAGLQKAIPFVRLNGHPAYRLPNNLNLSISYIEGEGMLLGLDMLGIAASSGSACTSGSLDPSHVLLAIGLDHATAHGSLRLTLSHNNSFEDVFYVLEKLPQVVERLRAMSPLYESEVMNCSKAEDCDNPLSSKCKV